MKHFDSKSSNRTKVSSIFEGSTRLGLDPTSKFDGDSVVSIVSGVLGGVVGAASVRVEYLARSLERLSVSSAIFLQIAALLQNEALLLLVGLSLILEDILLIPIETPVSSESTRSVEVHVVSSAIAIFEGADLCWNSSEDGLLNSFSILNFN